MHSLAKISLISLSLLIIAGISCRKLEEFPPEPHIAFYDFEQFIDGQSGLEKGRLKISYQDGDGDIGLDKDDLDPPFHQAGEFHFNFIVRYFEQQYGTFVEVPLVSWNVDTQTYDTNYLSTRIPPLIPKGQEKAISGIIEYEVFLTNPFSGFDTIMFKVKLVDRALNISNEVSTPPILRMPS